MWEIKQSPRPWQAQALQQWATKFRGIAHVVTGGGKTIFAFMCMLAFKAKFPEARFVIIVPTLALLDQWYLSLQEDFGVIPDDIKSFSGQEKPKKPGIVNLVVINTARNQAFKLAQGSQTMLIVDECHRAGSLINSLALQGTFVGSLGLSATPQRQYDQGFEEFIVPALGNIIYDYDYKQAAQDNVITPFELINVRVDFLPNEQDSYSRLTKKAAILFQRIKRGEASPDSLAILLRRRALVSSNAALRIPLAIKLLEQHPRIRTLVFHERVTAANTLHAILLTRKHSATIYHSKIGPIIRRDNLRLYRKGVFDVLISCRALDEGLNVPETAVAIIASSTASQRQRIQRLGRVLRPAKGKTFSTIYTIYATAQEEKRLIAEEKLLEGIASIKWFHGRVDHNG